MGVFDCDEEVSCWGDISPLPLNVISNESDLFEVLILLEFPMRPFRSTTSPGSLVMMTGEAVRGDRGDVGG